LKTTILVPYSQPTLSLTGKSSACQGENLTINVSGANSYTWSSSTGTSSSFSAPSTLGTTIFTVSGVTQPGNCIVSATLSVKIYKCANLEQNLRGIISIKPNPFIDQLSVDLTEDGLIEVFSMDASLQFKAILHEGMNQIDCSALPAGIYIVRLKIDERVDANFRIVKGLK
jgi:hypothetical protein